MDTNVLNTICVGSDHRMVRAKIYINTKLERRKYTQNKQSKIDTDNLKLNKSHYQEEIQHQVNLINDKESLNTLNAKITQCITKAAESIAKKTKQKQHRISKDTLDLIEKRKQLKCNEKNNTDEITKMNKTIRKKIRADIRDYNNKKVKETLEEGKSLKNTLKLMKVGRNNIARLTNENNEEITQAEQIIKLIENFYQALYDTKLNPPHGKTEAERVIVQNIGSEEIEDITKEEIAKSLNRVTNGKSPGEDGVIAEMLKHGGTPVLNLLEKLYNKCIHESTVPEDWNNALVVLIFKKGDKSKLSNYRPISLLSVMYKLFTRIITERLTNKLDSYQPREQAGFRKGFGTLDHLQTIRTLIEKANEYNMTLWIAFVDYEKAFDSIEIWAVLNALSNSRVDHRYTTLIQSIYKNATFQVQLNGETKTNTINIKRGVRQGDTISPKLFTLALEDMFKELNWDDNGIAIDGENLNHLRFADDIVLISKSKEELERMLIELNQKSKQIGMKMNINKTKYMTNEPTENENHENILIEDQKIEKVDSYIYLGQKIQLNKNNLNADLARRVSLAWATFGKLHTIFKSQLPNTLKARTFDQHVLPILTYGTESWAAYKQGGLMT